MRLENNSCTCGSRQASNLCEVEDLNFGCVDCTTTILECANCGSIRPAEFPVEQDIHLGYQNYYTTVRNRSTFRRLASNLIAKINKKYNLRYINVDYSSLLDFGCGAGTYLATMARANPQSKHYGTDSLRSPSFPSEDAHWIEKSGLDDFAPFDAVTLGHVIEHLKNPAHELECLSSLIGNKGRLVIITPNSKSIVLKAFGKYARDLDFPRHRIIFSRKELTRILEENELEKIADYGSPISNSIANVISSLKCVKRKNGFSTTLFFYSFLSLLLVCIIFVIRLLNLRSIEPETIIVAQKL